MTNSFELTTPDGETIEVEVEELTPLETLQWAGRMPDGMDEMARDDRVNTELIDFCVDLVEDRTVLTRELLHELPMDQLMKAVEETANRAFPDAETLGDGGEAEDSELDLDDDGSLDLDDWR